MRLTHYINEGIKVYLDDERTSPSGWIGVKTPTQAIDLLKKGDVIEISLDHDLGDDRKIGTGNDVLLWIEKQVFTNKEFKCPKIKIHTANPSARKKMELGLRSIKRKLK